MKHVYFTCDHSCIMPIDIYGWCCAGFDSCYEQDFASINYQYAIYAYLQCLSNMNQPLTVDKTKGNKIPVYPNNHNMLGGFAVWEKNLANGYH